MPDTLAPRRWVHQLFHPKAPHTQDFRFCKICWPEVPDAAGATDGEMNGWRLSAVFEGCVASCDGSTSGMVNHVRLKHPGRLPGHVGALRVEKDSSATPVDDVLSRRWAEHIAVDALTPVRLVDHARMVSPELAERKKMTAVLDTVTDDVAAEVHHAIDEAKGSGCRFAVQIDGWKTKTRRTRHYGAVLLNWCAPSWRPYQACIDMVRLKGKRDGKLYYEVTMEALRKVGLTPAHLVAALSDHEGAVRSGMRMLGTNAVGCGCHAFQLSIKHALPPRRGRYAANTSSSSASTSSSPSSSSSGSAASPAPAAPAPRPSRRDPAHITMQASMRPIVKRARALVTFYVRNTQAHDHIETDASLPLPPLPFRAFTLDSDTRWSSTQTMWMSVVDNAAAHNVTRALHAGVAYPAELTPDELQLLRQLVCVLEPLRVATKFLEGGGSATLSSYAPLFHTLSRAYGSSQAFAMPRVWRDRYGVSVQKRDLLPLPRELAVFLKADIQKVRGKHIQNTKAERLMSMATLLDPRFKRHECLTAVLEQTRSDLKDWAMQAHDAYPAIVEHNRRRAADPEQRTLLSLLPAPSGRRPKRRAAPKPAPGPKSAPAPAAPQGQRPRRELHANPSCDELLFGAHGSADAPQLEHDVAALIEQEIARYEALPALGVTSADPFVWWQQHSHTMPYIAAVAQWLLGTPSSTAAVERLFSAAGRLFTKQRPRLGKRGHRVLAAHWNRKCGFSGEHAAKMRRT